MDILKPELVWIDNRCYRKLPLRNKKAPGYYEDDESYSSVSKVYDDEDDASDLNIEFKNDTYIKNMDVPKDLMGFVIGKRGETKKTIESTSDVRIRIQKPADSASELVTIMARKKESVVAACRRIESILSMGRMKIPPTHFISIPMNSEEIQEAFCRFRDEVLENFSKVRGIHKSIFQEPAKLHLTVAMLLLLDDREKSKAASILLKAQTNILNILCGKKLVVEVKGLEYMNDDLSEVDVLYAEVHEADGDSCLQVIADRLCEDFIQAGFSRKEFDGVKLHITLMNSRFRSDEGRSEKQARETFDAAPIFERYKEYYFGKMTLSEIHISTRHTEGDDGYYKSRYFIKF